MGAALGQVDVKNLTDQRPVAERVRHADQARGDLEVKEVAGRHADSEAAQPHFLPAGVDDDDAAGSTTRRQKASSARSKAGRSEKVDRRGRLDETQSGVIAVFADELGVEAEVRVAGEVAQPADSSLGVATISSGK